MRIFFLRILFFADFFFCGFKNKKTFNLHLLPDRLDNGPQTFHKWSFGVIEKKKCDFLFCGFFFCGIKKN